MLFLWLVFRRYENGALAHQTELSTVLRCYYPEELLRLVADQGFLVTGAWGGYGGEPYGSGADLVVQIRPGT